MLAHAGRPADAILGGIDAVKFRSSMTLFHAAAPEEPRFAARSPPSSRARIRARSQSSTPGE